ncbi:SCP2 sterol-binding domain-containing protein [Actinomycetospora endophytica]|uniref:SCP2 sterol-binding domain-containing protein n=1 Tax=Actinomycetospora endophytica TaxID=2291215 RepID=A0ABS8P474_9PSEU|nr:SCP2 sterol-binding domain-containing protein [Actinomycetospora endophytica]MCD2193064.1 SCP2 sterol-binding domain-containing protein [Actinomycetospora endophytica]
MKAVAEKIDVNELGRSVDLKTLSEDDLVATMRDALAEPEGAKTVDASVFARLVKGASKSQLEAVMNSDARRPVIDAIFGRMSEFYSSSGASSKRQVVHWHVTGAPGGGSDDYQTAMQHGSCAVSTSLDEDPRTELFMNGTEFLKVVTNNANPITLFMTRKLKVSGDVGFATALQKMFTIPSA